MNTLIKGYQQRKCECKNRSSIISNLGVISLPNFVIPGMPEAYH